MPRKKDETPILTKKAVVPKAAAKKSVGRPRKTAADKATAPRRSAKTPSTSTSKTVTKKTIPASQTSSLVTAQPLSSVLPSHPEQVLYESESIREPIQTPVKTEKKSRAITRSVTKRQAASKPLVSVPSVAPVHSELPSGVAVASAGVPANAPQPQAASSVSPVPARRRSRLQKIALALGALMLLIGGWYVFMHRTPNYAAENSKLVAAVSKLAIVPPDETPSVTTVVDETKINQDFLRNAKKGDKVLLYFQSGRAIVYRPSTNQIVNIGPLETPKPRVFIRKGSATDNTGAVRTAIAKTSDFLLASQDESPNKTYTKTVVVDVTGNRPDLAGKLAQMLHVNVVPLPAGEDRPDADLMVIVGSE